MGREKSRQRNGNCTVVGILRNRRGPRPDRRRNEEIGDFVEMTSEALPVFRFHPDPVATGAVQASAAPCRCCGLARGFVVASVYAATDLDDAICPWCVADGSAARTHGASFVEDVEAGASVDEIEELLHRTPGYASWQGERWLVHCAIPMVFHGDLTKAELRFLHDDDRDRFMKEHPYLFEDQQWRSLVKHYEPGGQPALYKFKCSRCGTVRLGCDFP
jgi:uncharacterized protein